MKENNSYDVNNQSGGWIFVLILVLLFIGAIGGGYALYEHAVSPDNNLSFSEHTDLRDISDTNTATNLYEKISSNNVYYDMFYKEILSNNDYLAYGFTRSNTDIPSLYGESFTVLQNKVSKTIENDFYKESDVKSLYTNESYSNYQFRCNYDSTQSLYNCLTIPRDNNLIPMLYSNLIKVEQESEYFYVYDEAVFLRMNKEYADMYTDINYKNNTVLCDNTLKTSNTVCTGFTDDDEDLKDYIFTQYKDIINTYKHTFIKQNGTYYFVSTEIVKEEAAK